MAITYENVAEAWLKGKAAAHAGGKARTDGKVLEARRGVWGDAWETLGVTTNGGQKLVVEDCPLSSYYNWQHGMWKTAYSKADGYYE